MKHANNHISILGEKFLLLIWALEKHNENMKSTIESIRQNFKTTKWDQREITYLQNNFKSQNNARRGSTHM
jgi:hypothetical protein